MVDFDDCRLSGFARACEGEKERDVSVCVDVRVCAKGQEVGVVGIVAR